MWYVFSLVVASTFMVFAFVVPVATLLLVRRRSGSWRRAIRACAIVSTFGNLLILGTLAFVHTALNEMIFSRPYGSSPWWRSPALWTAPAAGIYGMLSALTFLPFSLLLVCLWRTIHRQSFETFIRHSSPVTQTDEVSR